MNQRNRRRLVEAIADNLAAGLFLGLGTYLLAQEFNLSVTGGIGLVLVLLPLVRGGISRL